MSEEITLFSIINSKISSTIHPQILQLINIYLVQYINTGDRVKDGCFTIIVNTLIALILSALYYGSIEIYNLTMSQFYSDEYEIDVHNVLRTHTKDIVSKYPHQIEINSCKFNTSYIVRHIQNTKKISNIHAIDTMMYIPFWSSNCCSLEITKGTDKNIFIPIYKYVNKKTKKYDYVFIYNACLVSQSFEELNYVVNDILTAYFKDIKSATSCNGNNTIRELGEGCNIIHKGMIESSITFDKIHFEEKDILLDWVDKFNEKKLYPSGLCMTNKLGILLYGPPGTGKTGCISALANKLKRGIILINSLHVCGKSKADLESVLRMHQETCIFVFDEFDYLLTASENSNKHSQPVNYQELLLYSDGEERKHILENIKEQRNTNSNHIDQAYILKLLDGIGDTNGRIIIATTNNPEKINKVFLRPGRFDLKLKLGFCTFDMFQNIIKTKFNNTIENTERIRNILEKNITPLILINKLIGSTNFEEMLCNLEQMNQQEYKNCLQN